MGVVSRRQVWLVGVGGICGCGEQEAGMASGSGWNLWVWLLGVFVRRYVDYLILLSILLLYLFFFAVATLLFVHVLHSLYIYMYI